MKKFRFNFIHKFCVVIALVAMAFSTTSCVNDMAEDFAKHMEKGISDGVDFNTAVDCLQVHCDWNEERGCYEKGQGSITDATSTMRRYTNNKMSIPGEWRINKDNYIIVKRATTPGDIFEITVKYTHTDDYGKTTNNNFKAYFKYD